MNGRAIKSVQMLSKSKKLALSRPPNTSLSRTQLITNVRRVSIACG